MDNLFRQQYLLCAEPRENMKVPELKIGDFSLYIGDALPRARLLAPNGSVIGYLFGVAVDKEGALVEGEYGGAPSPSESGWTAFEDWIEALTGRWGVVVADGKGTRLYTDACGMIGAVYDAETRSVAASLAQCLTRDVIDHPDYDHSAIEERGGKYTLFDTRDAYARRMNPSCYLDLDTFDETRFWPRRSSLKLENGSLEETYDWFARRTEKVVGAIAKRHSCWLPLTGGQDSRLVLAMSGNSRSFVEKAYTHINNYATRIDATIARQLAQKVDVEHEVHDRKMHKTKEKRALVDANHFHTALGFKMPPSSEIKNGLHLKVPRDAVILRGHQTDILRAVFSRKIGPRARRNTRWQVQRLMPVPRAEFTDDVWNVFRPRYETWMSSLPKFAAKNSTDLMFLEIYYSSTIGCSFPALYRNFSMSPFNGRAEIGRAMAIDEKFRQKSNAVFDIINRFAPALDSVPFDHELGSAIDKIDSPNEVEEMTRDRRNDVAERKEQAAAE